MESTIVHILSYHVNYYYIETIYSCVFVQIHIPHGCWPYFSEYFHYVGNVTFQ